MIRFIIVALFVVLFLICSIPLLIAEYIIGKFNMDVKNRSSLAIVNWAFRCVLFLAGTSVTVLGEENVPKDEPVLYIGNHRSYFDIVMTYVRVPRPTGYIAKVEMQKLQGCRKNRLSDHSHVHQQCRGHLRGTYAEDPEDTRCH